MDTDPPPSTEAERLWMHLGELDREVKGAAKSASDAKTAASEAKTEALKVGVKVDDLSKQVGDMGKELLDAFKSISSTQRDVAEFARKDRRRAYAIGGGIGGAVLALVEALRLLNPNVQPTAAYQQPYQPVPQYQYPYQPQLPQQYVPQQGAQQQPVNVPQR